ncbi:TBC domain-containing protein C1952.17c isoform X2 [Jatropha curcas]|uniref:TBC domain-containing protein C1952.17c isoform X2 n=1 Tax=Jatropha curcas TaxID=180498 RepID=UPI0005FB22CA|nr:TBC domain-containing protein C1952.17c isoform X2 [Jatropha curcas]
MLKGKLKLPDKARRVFPDRLGSLVAGLHDREDENGGSDPVFESGEELGIIQPNGAEFDKGNDYQYQYEYDDGGDDGVGVNGKINKEEYKVRKGPEKDGAGQLSAMAFIAADEKRSDLEYELSQKEINLEKLRRIATTGLPEGGGLRATTWKLLLGYLPPSRDLWEKELTDNRQKYAKLKEELLLSPSELTKENDDALNSDGLNREGDVAGPLKRQGISHEDHPLSVGKASAWNQYFQHTEIADQIDRDLQRTHPNIKFFSGDSSFSRKNRNAMRNILLLFAKLNPAICYVQGMNEVLAPILYVFSTDSNEQNAANAEADSFSCFVRLLSDSVDHFCQQLDNSPVGILSTLSRLTDLLKLNDEELWRHLEFTTKVDHIITYSRVQFPVHLKNLGFYSEQPFWRSGYAFTDMLCNVAVCEKQTIRWGFCSKLEAFAALS